MILPPSADNPVTYGLLRHGQTVWNSQKRVQGHGNSPLTETGKRETTAWAACLAGQDWQHILCSDLGRVQETVRLLNAFLNLPVTVDARLREQDWGDWEGMKVADVYRDCAEELAVQSGKGWDFRPPGGESRREVRDRAFSALAAARATVSAERILVVCHLGVIKCLVYTVAGRRFLADETTLLEKEAMHHLYYRESGYHLGPLNITLKDQCS